MYTKDGLSVQGGPLTYSPVMRVEPNPIETVIQSNATNEITFTLAEIRGKMPLTSVRLRCTDLASPVETIKGSTVKFDLNSFDVPAGGSRSCA